MTCIKYRIAQNFGREKLGEMNVIRQYFTQPNSRFIKVANVSYCKFAKFFLAKTLKQLIRQSSTLPKFCAIRYTYSYAPLISTSMYAEHIL